MERKRTKPVDMTLSINQSVLDNMRSSKALKGTPEREERRQKQLALIKSVLNKESGK